MSVQGLAAALSRMLETGEGSDLKFTCNGTEFSVHSSLVCAQSPMLRAAIRDGFQEAESMTISMDAYEPRIVKKFIQYLYTGNYEGHEPPEAGSTADAEAKAEEEGTLPNNISLEAAVADHVRVNAMGDYYGVSGLPELVNEKIGALVKDEGQTKLLIPSLPMLIQQATTSTGDCGVLDVFADVAKQDMDAFLESEKNNALTVFSHVSKKLLENLSAEVRELTKSKGNLLSEAEKTRRQLQSERDRCQDLMNEQERDSNRVDRRLLEVEYVLKLLGD